jgi:hypothetical protein
VLVSWAPLLLSENLAVPLVLFALLVLLRPPFRRRAANVAAVGLALGLAVHTRSELALVAAVAVLWVGLAPSIHGERTGATPWRRLDALWIACAVTLSLLPWTVRNASSLGGFVFVRSFSGPVLYYANNEGLRSAWSMAQGETPGMPPEIADLPPGDELALDRYLRGRAIAFIRDHPDRFATAAALKSAMFWRPIAEPWRGLGGWANRLLPGVAAFWLAVIGLAVAARRPRPSALMIGVLAAQAVFVALFGAWERERFRTPLYPIELMLLAAGLVWLGVAAWRVASARPGRGPHPAARIQWRTAWLVGVAAAAVGAFALAAHRDEAVVVHESFDDPGALSSWQRLQGTESTVAVVAPTAAAGAASEDSEGLGSDDAALPPGGGSGSLRLVADPPAGWQDIQLPLAAGQLRPNRLYRVTFRGRASGGGGGQVYPLIPAGGPEPVNVGLVRYAFGDGGWRDHAFYFTSPFDSGTPVAVYVSHADYQVPGAVAAIDDLTVRRSGWSRFLWDGYVRGVW